MPSSSSKPGAVVVLGSLHYDIMVEAPDRLVKGETVTGTNLMGVADNLGTQFRM